MARSLADGAAQADPPSQWRLRSGWPPLLYQTALSELYNLAVKISVSQSSSYQLRRPLKKSHLNCIFRHCEIWKVGSW